MCNFLIKILMEKIKIILKNNNSMTALKIFLKTKQGKKFRQDNSFQNRYFLTLNPFGVLKKLKTNVNGSKC